MKMARNEDAVSPVIGVILMVAVTVILAAVIAAFVFGMSGNISKSHTVAATGQVANGQVIITYNGGQDASQVQGINLTVDGAAPASPYIASLKDADLKVGSSLTGPRGHAVVTAYFSDGSTSVILDSTY